MSEASPSGRLRIAFLSFDFGEVAFALAGALGRDADVCLMLPHAETPEPRPALPATVRFHPFHKPRLRQPLRQLRTSLALVRRIRRFNPDVVHIQQGHLWFNLALPLLARYPLVVTIHDAAPHPGDRGGEKTPAAAMQLAFRRADELIAHAEEVKRQAVGRGTQEERIQVMPHVAIGALVPRTGLPERKSEVLFFGRIWPYKGLDYLIRAQPAITAEVPDAHFVIAGKGEGIDRYLRMMRDPSHFEVHNRFLSAADRGQLFERASVVVLPYLEASQSGVVPVAYAYSRPVVVTSVGGLPEAVEDGVTGVVVPPGDERALAEAVTGLLRSPEVRRRLGEAGRERFETTLSPEALAKQTLAVYARARARRGSGKHPTSNRDAALALHAHLEQQHRRDGALVGPDYGIRLNYRLGRFIKSYSRRLPWRDQLYYLQAQGYWTLANWSLSGTTGEQRFEALALACSREMLRRQHDEGSWAYPHPGWTGRIATAEGTWAAMALLESYGRSGRTEFLDGARRWHAFLEQRVGWQPAGDGLAVNYFGDRPGNAVPNNSVLVLRFLAALTAATGDDRPLRRAPDLLAFLASVQRGSGELPYSIGAGGRAHFQCYQYNAFQALDLIAYIESSGDEAARPLVAGLAGFLRAGMRRDGRMPYACDQEHPEVPYHLAAAAAALRESARLQLGDFAACSGGAYERLLRIQRPDGSFPHSLRDYGRLSDRRSYPRSQAMILHHLLLGAAA